MILYYGSLYPQDYPEQTAIYFYSVKERYNPLKTHFFVNFWQLYLSHYPILLTFGTLELFRNSQSKESDNLLFWSFSQADEVLTEYIGIIVEG